jgi:acetaldehyde dehydrogenase / alcohol dehydrogenase
MSVFHSHGLANALLINSVIRYNSTGVPFKQTSFPQYTHPSANARCARISDRLALGGRTPGKKVEWLIVAIDRLKKEPGLPGSIREAGIAEKEFHAQLDTLAANAFDDQCTGTNPRFPRISEIEELFLRAYEGKY